MNKNDLITALAATTKLSKTEAATALDAILETVTKAWRPGDKKNYRTRFVGNPSEALRRIFVGIGSLSRGEMAGERMEVPLASQDQEDEQSCFSDNTHRDLVNDALGIENVWLGRYVRADGHLFFTCFLDESIADFEDRSPKRDGGRCFYNPGFLTALVEGCGWRLVARAPGEGPLIGDSFVGRPLGLDRYPELIGDILGNYRRVVYLAQSDDPDLRERAEECAASLGLELEFRQTGYGRLAQSLSSFVAIA